ncbi:PIG-L family deacetylase [Lysinibacter sp. HNR]|uniref:PIG-L family deacetylase n=1 Tax=Lysinibacter sp. HNR TaxID=3031408 RepID=UPI002435F602|nr:PIG-L family deacetylase [Lysinibacter sp. HNR]WGD37331.1 PIG-L family deacetylase [Lysinibacter sp. HNR]
MSVSSARNDLRPVADILDAQRVLFIHAHPDDETIATGGTIALLVARGANVTVLTSNRGEGGEVVAGNLSSLEGTEELGPYRAGEVLNAMAALGVTDQRFLGSAEARASGKSPREYRDSGMQWGSDGFAIADPNSPADAFCKVPFEEVLDDARLVARETYPDAIVSYDERGGYGHPDHIRCHRIAAVLASELDVPFYMVIPATSSERVDYEVDVEPVFEQKVAALRAHQTQLTVEGDSLVHSGGQRQVIDRVERFRQH